MATNSSMGLINKLARRLSTPPTPRQPSQDRTWFVGPNGPTLIDEELLALATVAELHDEKSRLHGAEPQFKWILDAHGMRQVIYIAHQEPDPDLALLAILSHTNILLEEEEEDDEEYYEE